jgi:DNA-binding transcriptional LysR family regulator
MLNLNQLQHFRFVAETGNFAAAARKAHITQPALSNSIRILEQRMEVQLFDRSERPIRLTPAGRNVLNRIDFLLHVARNVEKEVSYLSQGLAGELRIGMTSVSSASFGGVILGKWLAKNNKMRVDVSVANT